MGSASDFLYARPSFLEGIARLGDLAGALNEYNTSDHPDRIALAMDWRVVGDEMHRAVDGFESA